MRPQQQLLLRHGFCAHSSGWLVLLYKAEAAMWATVMRVMQTEALQQAQLQPPPRPQISSNKVVERYPPLSAEREAMPENSSWQPVGKKRHPRKRQRSTKQGVTVY